MSKQIFLDENRRRFVKRALMFAAFSPLMGISASCQTPLKPRSSTSGIVGGGCDGCEGIYEGLPTVLSAETAIASASEPGERMEINGIIYQLNGKTPAPNVILYVYHTDAKGYYSPAPNTFNLARRHGHLRGWMKTNARGEYRFTTIRPAPYPGKGVPAHIHPIVKEPDRNEYYFDEYLFDDDPFLTREARAKCENRGGSGIIRLTKRDDGFWIGRRDIILGLNIPDYV